MRVTKYVKSDGNEWIMVKLNCSAHVAYHRLNNMMLAHGWVPWHMMRDKFNELKKKLARENPIKYPNWKEVEIPMRAAKSTDYPAAIQQENVEKLNDQPAVAAAKRPDVIIYDDLEACNSDLGLTRDNGNKEG